MDQLDLKEAASRCEFFSNRRRLDSDLGQMANKSVFASLVGRLSDSGIFDIASFRLSFFVYV